MTLNRDTAITWLGHATVLIETPGNKRLLLDPWTEGNPACPPEWKSPDALGNLDIVLITHAHVDHIGDAATIFRAYPDAAVVSIFDLGPILEKRGAVNFKGMNKGGSQVIDGITITMTQAQHSSSAQDEDGRHVYGGEPVGYVLQLENGFTIYAAGDTAVFGDMALIKELYQPELAILPIGDHFTMGPKEAALAVRLLGVSKVVPIHHATFPLLTGTPEALLQHTSGDLALTVYALNPGETLR